MSEAEGNGDPEKTVSLLTAALESTADGIIVVDLNGRITHFNRNFVEMLRIPGSIMETRDQKQVLAFTLAQVKDPEKLTRYVEWNRKNPERESFDLLELKNGRIFERSARPQLINGKIVGTVLTYHEVTERHRAREALMQSEEQLRTLINSLPDTIQFKDSRGRWVEANQAAVELFHLEGVNYHGKTDLELAKMTNVSPESFILCNETDEQCCGVGSQNRVEGSLPQADGARRTYDVIKVPLFHPDGKRKALTIIGRDITERKLAEEQIQRYAVRTKVLADASQALAGAQLDLPSTLAAAVQRIVGYLHGGCLIELISRDGKRLKPVAYFHENPEELKVMFKFLGGGASTSTEEGVAGKVVRTGKAALLPDIPREEARGQMAREYWPYYERFPIRGLIVVPLRVGGRVIGAAAAIRGFDAPLFSGDDLEFVQDFADRTALAIDNASLYDEAQEAISLREDFMAIASHELKTPLSPLRTQLQLLTRLIKTGMIATVPRAQELLKLIATSERQLLRLNRLVDDLLEVSRLSGGQLTLNIERVDFGKLLNEVIARFGSELSAANCKIKLSAEPDIFGMWDHLRIEQVVTNLMTNAIKYGSGKPIEIRVEALGNHFKMALRDFGIGIAKEDQERVFDRFERAVSYKRFSGLGLGLYITRQIVNAHGGSIRVESAPGEGSTFIVELPLEGAGEKLSPQQPPGSLPRAAGM